MSSNRTTISCHKPYLTSAVDADIFFERLTSENPNPRIALDFNNHFTLLVAVLLSAQSTDIGVNRATKRLFEIADTPKRMLDLGEDLLKKYIRVLGLFNSKARNIIRLSSILVNQYQGQVPDNRDELEQLPGIGRKSAGVILNVAFGHSTIAVDTHVFRLCNRSGLAAERTPKGVEQILEKVVPPYRKLLAHHWLVLHGRHVCTARKPKCPTCIVNDLCIYPHKTKKI